jgi:hypothetical protein
MKDCILSLLWPREDILTFFRSSSCTEADLGPVTEWKRDAISRSRMVDLVFSKLDGRPDSGLGQYRAMLHNLLSWSRFDPYYFDTLRKLDRGKAEACLTHLRQLQEIRDARIKEDRQRREEQQQRAQEPTVRLIELKAKYLSLLTSSDSRQQRGYELEKLLLALARLDQLEVTEPFKVTGEQIDGAIKFEGEHYILEAKWQDKFASNEPLYQLAGKVEGKMYGRGIFVSVNGFSPDALTALVTGKALRTILVDGEDLVNVLEGAISFKNMIDRKVKAAQTRGLIYIHALTSAPKT